MKYWKVSEKTYKWLDEFRQSRQSDFKEKMTQEKTITELKETIKMYRKLLGIRDEHRIF